MLLGLEVGDDVEVVGRAETGGGVPAAVGVGHEAKLAARRLGALVRALGHVCTHRHIQITQSVTMQTHKALQQTAAGHEESAYNKKSIHTHAHTDACTSRMLQLLRTVEGVGLRGGHLVQERVNEAELRLAVVQQPVVDQRENARHNLHTQQQTHPVSNGTRASQGSEEHVRGWRPRCRR